MSCILETIWRQFTLVTDTSAMSLPPTSLNYHHYKVTNIKVAQSNLKKWSLVSIKILVPFVNEIIDKDFFYTVELKLKFIS